MRGVMVGAHRHPPSVGADVVDPVRVDLTQLFVGEIVDIDLSGVPFGLPLRPLFLKAPTSSFFFASTLITGSPLSDDRVACSLI